MKPLVQKNGAFIAKSLLWSLLLYVVLMAAFNWDDVSNTITGRSMITVVSRPLPEGQNPEAGELPPTTPAAIALHNGMAKNIVAVLKIISGVAGHTPGQ